MAFKDILVYADNAQYAADRLDIAASWRLRLARHSVRVSAMAIQETCTNDGPLILARAAEIGADMIVMGAYGHSRLREVVMGGVANHILKQQHVPVFMSH